jgi:hypothetical protein
MVVRRLRELVVADEGMEMVEWSIVGVIFALASALVWTSIGTSINSALTDLAECVSDQSNCP